VLLLPKNVSYEEGVFIEPLACVVRGQRVARFKKGQSVLILGAGVSGIMHLMLARASKAGNLAVTDIDPYRLDFAKRLGAKHVIDARADVCEEFRKINKGLAADLVIVCTGSYSAFLQGLNCVDKGGTILFFAPITSQEKLPVPVNDFWRNEIKLATSYGASPDDLKEALKLISTKKVAMSRLITHRLSLDEIGSGFKLVAGAKDSMKVILTPDGVQ
jgi:L-iditol 2-dehydrogenase